jgi:hypothetical protein
MSFKSVVALGLLVLATCAGCAGAPSSLMGNPPGADGAYVPFGDDARWCARSGGRWVSHAGVCDQGRGGGG